MLVDEARKCLEVREHRIDGARGPSARVQFHFFSIRIGTRLLLLLTPLEKALRAARRPVLRGVISRLRGHVFDKGFDRAELLFSRALRGNDGMLEIHLTPVGNEVGVAGERHGFIWGNELYDILGLLWHLNRMKANKTFPQRYLL